MTGTIKISGLKANAIIGIYKHEQDRAQPIWFDIELTTDIGAAAASDNINDALDYDALCRGVVALAQSSRCGLLESLVSQIADWIVANFSVRQLKVTVSKPLAVAAADNISLTVCRGG